MKRKTFMKALAMAMVAPTLPVAEVMPFPVGTAFIFKGVTTGRFSSTIPNCRCTMERIA